LDGRRFGIACGQIDIGNAATDMTEGISRGALQADGSVGPEPTFDAEHVAGAVLYMASLPLDANVQFLTITATAMPFIGRGGCSPRVRAAVLAEENAGRPVAGPGDLAGDVGSALVRAERAGVVVQVGGAEPGGQRVELIDSLHARG